MIGKHFSRGSPALHQGKESLEASGVSQIGDFVTELAVGLGEARGPKAVRAETQIKEHKPRRPFIELKFRSQGAGAVLHWGKGRDH